jgi:hypothetical protein
MVVVNFITLQSAPLCPEPVTSMTTVIEGDSDDQTVSEDTSFQANKKTDEVVGLFEFLNNLFNTVGCLHELFFPSWCRHVSS